MVLYLQQLANMLLMLWRRVPLSCTPPESCLLGQSLQHALYPPLIPALSSPSYPLPDRGDSRWTCLCRVRYAVWFGGSLVASVPDFYRVCCTKAQYEEEGPRIAR